MKKETDIPALPVNPEIVASNETPRDFGLLGRVPVAAYIAGLGVGVPLTIAEGWFGAAVSGVITLGVGFMSRETTFNAPIEQPQPPQSQPQPHPPTADLG